MKREKVESSILLIFFILSLIVCGYWVYFRLTWNRTTWSAYKGSILSYAEDKTYPIEINYFSNKNNNGLELFEIKFNYYTDTSTFFDETTNTYKYKDIYSTGVQFYNSNKFKCFDRRVKAFCWRRYSLSFGNVTYFNSFENKTFIATKELNYDDSFILDLDKQIAKLTQRGYDKNRRMPYKIENCPGCNNTHYENLGYNIDYNIPLFTKHLMEKTMQGCENGINSLVMDLSDFFSIEMFDEQSGQFYKATNSTTEKVYITCKVSKSDDGFVSSKQSLFGFYKNDAEYGSNTNNYWKSLTDYTITERDLIYTKYSDNTYTARLSDKCIEYITKFSDMNIDLKIDLDSYYLSNRNIEIYALEKDFLGGLNVSNISIVSQENRVIRLYENYDDLSLVNVTVEVLV